MDDEFKLCWKNFQDNIASGFQNLYDRGDLVDVTLACDGKLLHAHKIVLAICSPYFQEIFITNPCKHPIIILKDVTFNIMCELLEFMYQGVVNVKHTELQSFMKIGQLLQIKGLATNASSTAGSGSTDKTVSQTHNSGDTSNTCGDVTNHSATAKSGPNSSISGDDANAPEGLVSVKLSNPVSVKSHSPASSPSPMGFGTPVTLNQQNFKTSPETNTPLQQAYHVGANLKRHAELNSDVLSIYSRKQFRRSMVPMENNADHSDSADADTESDFFLSSIPHLTTNTSAAAAAAAAASFRGTFNPAAFGFDYNLYKNSGAGTVGIGAACGNSGNGSGGPEYPNDLHMPSDYSKNFTNHMDIPSSSSNVVMLSSTSLLHGHCVFNRNNTVATQQGMKTYWLCKSYRISMCRARCITHQGRVISATGVHNHPPHMRSGSGVAIGAAGSGHLANSNTGVGFSIDPSSQQSGTVSTSLSPTSNLNSINVSGVLLSGSGNGSGNTISSSGARPHHPTSGSGIGTPMYQQHNPMHNSPSQQLQLHPQQQQQQQQQLLSIGNSTSPSMMGSAHVHVHSSQLATNILLPHQSVVESSVAGNSQGTLLHHHHQNSIGNSGNSAASQVLHSNSVIQNILHNANATNIMQHHHHTSMTPTMHHHHPHSQHQPHLEITPLMQSPPLLHDESPSNCSNQSQHGSAVANSLSSPITTAATTGTTSSEMKSPQASLNDEAACVSEAQSQSIHSTHSAHLNEQQQQHMLNHGTTLSPSEINSNTVAPSHSTNNTTEARHQAHVIDSITISPGEGGHDFKMEDM